MYNTKSVKNFASLKQFTKQITLQEQAGLRFAGYDSFNECVEWIGEEANWKRYAELLEEQEFATL